MRIQKRLLAMLFAAVLACALCAPVYAHDVPDVDYDECSISVTMKKGDTAVGGGTLTLYRVGDVAEDDGNYSFDTINGENLTELEEPAKLADELLACVQASDKVTTVTVASDGTAEFTGLKPGLYLVVQEQAASGYEKAEPFLVTLPQLVQTTEHGEVYVYDVDASPKVAELKAAPPAPVTPSTPSTPGGTLPQTGQLNWPVPVLAALGLALFAAGWMLRFGKKGRYEE